MECFYSISTLFSLSSLSVPPFSAICQAFLSVLYRRKWKGNGFTFMEKILSN
ncbi:hypothetical protein B4119_0211 [Parageobacillus caldoxylosilyticus]|uniref:Uncharacterized protein n=1 Tax=Saccharococcus caldoxylosilyticus TaxID=81408 RepID=A0A150KWK7_9BACL|nr:hypothetical protein B4119_0211 [Parageobacillus caldoxylosilyticus]